MDTWDEDNQRRFYGAELYHSCINVGYYANSLFNNNFEIKLPHDKN